MSSAADVSQDLLGYCSAEKAAISQRFFKTGPGEYGEGDVFIGVTVPHQRKVAKKYYDLSLVEITKLLHSKIHEERLTAVIILVEQFKRSDADTQRKIYNFYLDNTRYLNNWDIIDSSAPYIVSVYLWNNFAQHETPSKEALRVLTRLARSQSVWDRRIAIMSTSYFIQQGDVNETFTIATVLLHDAHDLVQKAVGWMLREVGNSVGHDIEEQFLKQHYKSMPRTMLRYAIEKFDEPKRKAYLAGTI